MFLHVPVMSSQAEDPYNAMGSQAICPCIIYVIAIQLTGLSLNQSPYILDVLSEERPRADQCSFHHSHPVNSSRPNGWRCLKVFRGFKTMTQTSFRVNRLTHTPSIACLISVEQHTPSWLLFFLCQI